VLPGVPLLSRRRWSGFPIDFAIVLGTDLITLLDIFLLIIVSLFNNFN
jgi:hypothetical protein